MGHGITIHYSTQAFLPYRAGCQDCGWKSKEFVSHDLAVIAGEEHRNANYADAVSGTDWPSGSELTRRLLALEERVTALETGLATELAKAYRPRLVVEGPPHMEGTE
jgi:hypothetical protein